MLRTIIAILVILSSASSAWALKIVSQPESSVELTLADLTLPDGTSGSIRFRTCSTCKFTALRVTAATKYLVDDRELALEDFLLTAAGIRDQRGAAESTFAGVFVDVASQNVNRIALSRRKQ